MRQDPIYAAWKIFVSGCRYSLGLAEDVQAEIDIVDQQIEDTAAALRGVGQPRAPGRSGAAPAENGGADLAEAPGTEDIRGRPVGRNETHHLGSHEDAAVKFGLGDHAICGGAIERHGLFDEHVFAGAQGQDRDALVQMGGQADVHGFYIGIVDRVFGAAVFRNGREVQLFARPAEIAGDAGEVAGQAQLIIAGYGGQLRFEDLPPRLPDKVLPMKPRPRTAIFMIVPRKSWRIYCGCYTR